MNNGPLTFVIPTYRLREVGEAVAQYDEHFFRNGHSVDLIGERLLEERRVRRPPGRRRNAIESDAARPCWLVTEASVGYRLRDRG